MTLVPPQPLPTAALAAEAAADVQQKRQEELRNANAAADAPEKKDFPLKFCTVCASNQNRFVSLFFLCFPRKCP
jgi:RNA polymerase II subunit A C-terminal domain phosphatase SSU72